MNPEPNRSQEDESRDITPIGVWRVLLKRKTLVAAVLLLALLTGVVLALRKPRYTAEGSLQIRPGSANMYRTQVTQALGGGDTDDRIETEVSILQSTLLFTQVADELHLASDHDFAGKWTSPNASMKDPRVQSEVVRNMRKMVRIERTPKTQILNIQCTSTSPVQASAIVNTLVNAYIEHVFTSRFGSTQRASKFLTTQLDDLKNQVLSEQKELIDLQSRLGMVGLDDSHNLVTAQLEDLARANQSAGIARITAEARYRILQDARPDLIDGGPALLSGPNAPSPSSLIQTLRGNQAQLSTQYASVSEQFGPNYPETRRLKAELDEANLQATREEGRILEQARIAFEAAQRNETLTSDALKRSQNQALGERNDMVSYQILLHTYQSNRTLYEGLLQRLREAGVVSGLESGEVEVVDLATVPVDRVGLSPLSLIGVALAIGILLALILALIVDTTDISVHSGDDLERFIGLPVLAVLPTIRTTHRPRRGQPAPPKPLRDGGGGEFEVLRAPQSPFSEGIRILRSSVLLAQAGQRPHTLLFTSALPAEGKSTVCGNVACLLAQAGSRVLLIDADLRRPSQHVKFNLPNTVGLSAVLTGRTPFADAVQPSAVLPQLSVLTSGRLPPSPGDLLCSGTMRQLMEQVTAQYDFVLLDTPPSLNISDAGNLSEFTDLCVLVVRDGVANKRSVQRTVNILKRLGGRVSGFVYNGVDRRSKDYYEYNAQYGTDQYGLGAEDA